MRDLDALVAYIEARAAMPFAWGHAANDCVSHADGAVQAQIGCSLVRKLGVTWRSERAAARVLNRFGGLAAAVDSVLPRIPPAMALRGDLGLVEVDGRPSLVVFEGATVVGPGEAGLSRLPRAAVREVAWSIAELAL